MARPDRSDAEAATAPYRPEDTQPYAPPDATAGPIPGYRILAEIARGGMGQVFAAHHVALDREVAIKTLLPGANADRFVTESKITARLPHPGIPPVHELGTLADGSPFLAMKLIRGRTLSELLKARPSPAHDLPRYVQVFEQVAQAVGFAHSRGIIHRDLKPLNVMVGEFGEVQVMDWGLAKDTTAAASPGQAGGEVPCEDANLTHAGTVLGTPGYMAPEQARAESLDPRADVFALGAVLATVLTGQPAFVGTTAKETIQKAAAADLADVFARLDGCGADADLVALARRCLSADRASRPVDGQAVAAEVGSYRAGVEDRLRRAETEKAEAVVREGEQRKRQRVVLAGVAAVAAMLLLGTAVSLWQMNRAMAAEGQATLNAEEAERKRQEAETNLGFSKKGNEILGSVFDGIDPDATYASVGEFREALKAKLEKAVRELDGAAIGDPLTVAVMQNKLGRALLGLGEAKQAVGLLEKARDTCRAKRGSDHRDTLTCMTDLATAYKFAGQYAEALKLARETYDLAKAKLGADHPFTHSCMNNLAGAHARAGDLDKALPLYEEAFELHKAHRGPDHPDTLTCMINLGAFYRTAGKYDQAVPLLEDVYRLRKATHGADHPDTLTGMNSLAVLYWELHRLDESIPMFEELLLLQEKTLGRTHSETVRTVANLAVNYRTAGRLKEALPLYEEAYRLRKRQLGADHPDTLGSMNGLAVGYRETGKLAQALPLFEAALALRKEKLGPDHPDTLQSMNNLALGYTDAGKLDRALPLYEETFDLLKAKLGVDHPHTLVCMGSLAMTYKDAGKLDRALPLMKEALALTKAKLGNDHPETLRSMNNLAVGYHADGKLDQALPLFEETITLRKARLGADHADTLQSVINLALAYRAAGKADKALPLFEEAYKLRKATLGPDHPDTLLSMNSLAGAYRTGGRPDKSLPLCEELVRLRSAKLGDDHPDTLKTMNDLGICYWSLRQLNRSVPLYEKLLARWEKKVGRDHPETQLTVANLGVNYKDSGRLTEALPLLEEAYRSSARMPNHRWVSAPLLDAYAQAEKKAEAVKVVAEILAEPRKTLPKDSPHLASILAHYGTLLQTAGAFADAEPLLRECLAICEKTQPEAWSTFTARAVLGASLLKQKKYADAEPLLVKGYEGMKEREKAIPPGAAARIPEALDRLVELYTETDKPDEAKKYQELRAKYPLAKPDEMK